MPVNDAFFAHCRSALAGIPPWPPWSRGWCAAVAGILEAAAAKPGNVHPGRSFPDLTCADLSAAAIASAGVLAHADRNALGETILAAVRASRRASPSNANLGIVLLITPLAAAPTASLTAAVVDGLLAGLGPADAAAIWEAIALARPGGLGRSDRWDVAGPPPSDIVAAMRHAASRDTIARLWSHGYADLFAGPVADLAQAAAAGMPLEEAIVRTHLLQLAREPDSLIARRHGTAVAHDVSRRAVALISRVGHGTWPAELVAFDSFLRHPRRLNPGTTADLVAAALYIVLRDGRLRPALPFTTPPFPEFAIP